MPPPPGPYEDRSLVTPALFDLVIDGGACIAIRRETGARVTLTGVACKPLD